MPRTRLGSAKLIINGTPMPQRAIVTPSSIDPALVLGLFAFAAADILDGVESLVITDTATNEGYDLEGGAVLNALEFPNLATLGADAELFAIDMPALGDLAFPALLTAGFRVQVQNCLTLGTVTFPVLTTANLLTITDNPLLTDIAIPSLTSPTAVLTFTNNALTEASVDAILARLVAIPTWGDTGQSANLSGGTSAPPSVTGAADAATLIARGASVTTN